MPLQPGNPHPPACTQVHNNFGGGFVSDEDRVALSAIKFASAESAGAKCISAADGHNSWLEASMEQLCVPLPPWSLRAGARETIWFNPSEVNAASESRTVRKFVSAARHRVWRHGTALHCSAASRCAAGDLLTPSTLPWPCSRDVRRAVPRPQRRGAGPGVQADRLWRA